MLASAATGQPIACQVVVRVACTPVVTIADGDGPSRRSSLSTRPETTGVSPMSPPRSMSSAPPESDHLPSSKLMRYRQPGIAAPTGTRARIVSPTAYVSCLSERVIAKR